MSSEHHNAVRWDGKRIVGGAPAWIVIANQKGPLTRGGIMRIQDTVHVFDNDTGHLLAGVAKPGDWILMKRLNGDLTVQTHEQMCTEWQYDGIGYRRRDSVITTRAGTELDLMIGLQLQAGWVQVRPTNFPRLHEVMEHVSHDRGSGAGHELYAVPRLYAPMLEQMEKGLATLSSSDRQTFSIGDEEERELMCRTHAGLRLCSGLLDAFHEDWENVR